MDKEERDRVHTIVKDTLEVLLRNSVKYQGHFTVSALVGISLDSEQEFHFSIKETINRKENTSDKSTCRSLEIQTPKTKLTEKVVSEKSPELVIKEEDTVYIECDEDESDEKADLSLSSGVSDTGALPASSTKPTAGDLSASEHIETQTGQSENDKVESPLAVANIQPEWFVVKDENFVSPEEATAGSCTCTKPDTSDEAPDIPKIEIEIDEVADVDSSKMEMPVLVPEVEQVDSITYLRMEVEVHEEDQDSVLKTEDTQTMLVSTRADTGASESRINKTPDTLPLTVSADNGASQSQINRTPKTPALSVPADADTSASQSEINRTLEILAVSVPADTSASQSQTNDAGKMKNVRQRIRKTKRNSDYVYDKQKKSRKVGKSSQKQSEMFQVNYTSSGTPCLQRVNGAQVQPVGGIIPNTNMNMSCSIKLERLAQKVIEDAMANKNRDDFSEKAGTQTNKVNTTPGSCSSSIEPIVIPDEEMESESNSVGANSVTRAILAKSVLEKSPETTRTPDNVTANPNDSLPEAENAENIVPCAEINPHGHRLEDTKVAKVILSSKGSIIAVPTIQSMFLPEWRPSNDQVLRSMKMLEKEKIGLTGSHAHNKLGKVTVFIKETPKELQNIKLVKYGINVDEYKKCYLGSYRKKSDPAGCTSTHKEGSSGKKQATQSGTKTSEVKRPEANQLKTKQLEAKQLEAKLSLTKQSETRQLEAKQSVFFSWNPSSYPRWTSVSPTS